MSRKKSTELAQSGKPSKRRASRYKDGKRIDRFTVEVEDGALCEVDVYLRSVVGVGQVLTAWCEEHQVEVTTSDLNGVRKAIIEKIRERLSYTWEPWLVVSVEERCNREGDAVEWDDNGDGLSLDLQVRVECYEFGLGSDGRKCYRPLSWHVSPPLPGQWTKDAQFTAGWIEPLPRHVSSENYGRGAGKSYATRAVIRDTPEVRAMLDAVRLGMHRLGTQLSELLSQGGIESLQQIGALIPRPMLPEGERST